ncbi:MAG: hypothetical protein AB7D36_05370 [Oscillospiraceae bacterium]
MDKKIEEVFAVPTALLRPYLIRRGLIIENTEKIRDIIMKNHTFLPRPEAEKDPGYRQIIPYVAITEGERVFSTRRLVASGEARLHGRISLGIGGHINPDSDGDGSDVLMRGLAREINEEVFIENLDMSKLRFLGFINDDSNDVGSVHLGLFCTLEASGKVSVRETDKLRGAWLSRTRLSDLADNMETWSSLIIEALK